MVTQAHARRSAEPKQVRLRWAKLSLNANARLHGGNPWSRAQMLHQNFRLRTWIIQHLGPDTDPDWDPDTLAADTLAALTLNPSQVTISAGRQDLPIEQIDELHQHRTLTAHLATLVSYLQPGPPRAQVAAWIQAREHLP
jgi:hypothetical protein